MVLVANSSLSITLHCLSKMLFLAFLRLCLMSFSGYTSRLAVVLQFSSSSMLMVSWTEGDQTISRTTLYQSQLDTYTDLYMDTTTNNHYSFTALEPCTSYVACVEIAGTQSLTCLPAVTGGI